MQFMLWCDKHQECVAWASEEVIIPYLSPVDNKVHRYFPDFLVSIKKNDVIENILIEIKPHYQTIKPLINNKGGKKKPSKRLLTEAKTYAVNHAKWTAAEKWCKDRKITFKIMTEYQLFGDKGK